MKIKKFDSGLLHSCMYIVEENGHAIVIDPCANTAPVGDLLVDYLIVTHEHYDHISGVNEWKKETGAPLVCSVPCAENIKSPRKNMSCYFDVFCEMQTWIPQKEIDIKSVDYVCEADITFNDRCIIEWQGHVISLMEIPGHSDGSIGICIDEDHFFSGDSLFEKYPIELRFPGGSKKKWNDVGKKRIEELKRGLKIWPGHFENFVL